MKTATQLTDELQAQMDKFQEYLDEAMRMAKELQALISAKSYRNSSS